MNCPKCNSDNVQVQIVNDVKMKTKHHNIIWWILVGWYWIPIKWIFLTLPALIVKIFFPKRQKIVTKQKTMCICQSCGYSWEKK